MWKRTCSLLLAAAIAVAMMGCARQEPEQLLVQDEIPVTVETDMPDATAAEVNMPAEKSLAVMLYYVDDSGCTVPVQRSIPWTEGIAKATLGYLVDVQADTVLQSMGLKAPLPNGTELELDIADGKATVDIGLPKGGFENAQQESAAIAAVVNTLLEFTTVEQVSLLFNGQKVSKLPHGTVVEDVYTTPLINTRPKGVPTTAEGKVELYYTNSKGQVLVPVYQVMNEKTPAAALQALLDTGDSGLVSLLPVGCHILSVTVSDDGTAKVDLSQGFESMGDIPGAQNTALRGIWQTCRQFEQITGVDVTVAGEPLQAAVETMAGAADAALNTYN